MTTQRNQPVRLGQPVGNGMPKWIWAGLTIAAAAGIAFFFFSPSSDDSGPRFAGCNANEECSNGRICAGGGCIILLSDENVDMWNADLAAQLRPDPGGPAWQPRPAYGLKLLPVGDCGGAPSPELKIEQQGAISTIKKANVFYVSPSDMQMFQQVDAQSNMWMSSLTFRLPKIMVQPPNVFCHGREVNAFRVTPSPLDMQVDVSLSQSVPVGAVAHAALLVKRPLPERGVDGSASIEFDLSPVLLGASEEVTALVLPIGTDILSLRGAQPDKQRLLHGHIAYYWKHDGRRREITAVVKLPANAPRTLNWEEIKP